MYTITLPAFEGPLDLLLQLIERARLDITKIALAQVADQYLAHVRTLDAPDPQALAEFVALAARLLLIKSRALLPRPAVTGSAEEPPDEDDGAALARQLREYQRYKQVAMLLQSWQEQGRQTFLRTAAPAVPTYQPAPTIDYTPAELIAAIERRVQLMLPLADAGPLSLPQRLTISEVAGRIRARLEGQMWFSFEDLLALTTTRQEIIVTFWAILELLKRRAIVVEQVSLFGPISIGRGTGLESAVAHIERAEE